MNKLVIGEDDRDLPAAVSLTVGDDLEIAVRENATTGYEWEASTEPNAVLSLAQSRFDAAPSGARGAAGTRHFVLTADHAGDATVTLELRRPWEAGHPPLRRVTVRVVVTGDDGAHHR